MRSNRLSDTCKFTNDIFIFFSFQKKRKDDENDEDDDGEVSIKVHLRHLAFCCCSIFGLVGKQLKQSRQRTTICQHKHVLKVLKPICSRRMNYEFAELSLTLSKSKVKSKKLMLRESAKLDETTNAFDYFLILKLDYCFLKQKCLLKSS